MKLPPKVVFDTNIYISAILFGGNPSLCLELARKHEVRLFISRAIMLELAQSLQKKFFWEDYKIDRLLEGIIQFAALVKPTQTIFLIKDDPKDNRILECAKEAGVDYIISGDKKHLLPIGSFDKIPIVTPQRFLSRYYKKN